MLHYCSYVSYRKTENSNGDKHMNDDKDTVNYMDSINKASRKRRRKPSFWEQYGILVIGAAVLAVIVVAVVFGGKAVNAVKGKMAAAHVVDYYNGVLFLACHTSSDIRIIRVLIEAVAEMHSCINNYRNLIHSILILG